MNTITSHGLILQGFVGTMGQPGFRGLAGPPGERGPAHSNPKPGPQGPAGIQGVAGEMGPVGPVGNIGQTGPPGLDGESGSIGPEGLPGIKGFEGPLGFSGIPGPKGPVGSRGSKGLPGPMGEAGCSWWKTKIISENNNNNISENNNNNISENNNNNISENNNNNISENNNSKVKHIIQPDDSNQTWIYHAEIRQWRLIGESRAYDGPAGPIGDIGPAGLEGSAGLAGPSGLPGPVGPIGPDETVFNVFYVDINYGQDSTAEKGRRSAPFATCKAAMDQASETDTILILNGHHRTSNLNKNNITWFLSPGVVLENIGDTPLFNGGYINVLGQGSIISKSYAAFDITAGSYVRIECQRILTIDCPAISISSGCRAKLQLQEIQSRGHSPAIINQGMLYLKTDKIFSDIDSCIVLLEGHSVINVNVCHSTSIHKSTVGIFGGSNYLNINCITGSKPLVLASTMHNIWAKCIISSIVIIEGQKSVGLDIQRLGQILNNNNNGINGANGVNGVNEGEIEVIGGNIDACLDIDQITSSATAVCGLQQQGGLVHIQCNSINLTGDDSIGARIISGVLSCSVNNMYVAGILGCVQRDAALSFVGQYLSGDNGWIFTNTLPSQLNIQVLSVNECNVLVDRPNDDNPLHLQIQYLGSETCIGVDHRRGYVIGQIANLRGGYRQSGGRSLLNIGQYFTQLDNNNCLYLSDGECRMNVGFVQHKGSGSCFEIQGGRLWIQVQMCVSQGSLARLSEYQNSHWSVISARSNMGWIIENGQTVIDVLDLECNQTCWQINKGHVDIYSTKVVGVNIIIIEQEAQISYKTLQTSASKEVLINKSSDSQIYLQGEFKSLTCNTIDLPVDPKKITIVQGILFTDQGESCLAGSGLIHNLNSLVCNKIPTSPLLIKNLQLIK